ncbi:inosine triphosphate pyrophosphatase-like protein [Penicillium sp. IBT 31633x]|nr:inosine triphosphate pyrophosphatase-like protein [Penicillium sp. IBT 31633x]
MDFLYILCLGTSDRKPMQSSKEFLNASDNEGLNRKLDGFNDSTAESVCTLVFCSEPGVEPIAYDPIFEVGGKTYAEMESEEKKALAKFQQWLIENDEKRCGRFLNK